MIVDAWAQLPTKGFLSHPMFASVLRWIGLKEIPEHIPIELLIAAMDAASVDVSVLCAWVGPDATLISNDEVAAQVAKAPDRLVGLAAVDIRDPVSAVRELRRAVNELGLVGVRILPWWWETPATDRRFYPLLAECALLGVPMCLQVGHTGPMKPSEFGRPIPYLDQVALDFPELVIVAGHIGYPWTTEMIALATKYENVYIDTSAYKASRYPAELVAFMNAHGSRKVMFGTNFPMITPRDALDDLDSLSLSAEASSHFLGQNAARVFRLPSSKK